MKSEKDCEHVKRTLEASEKDDLQHIANIFEEILTCLKFIKNISNFPFQVVFWKGRETNVKFVRAVLLCEASVGVVTSCSRLNLLGGERQS